jgi:hypothetical protein
MAQCGLLEATSSSYQSNTSGEGEGSTSQLKYLWTNVKVFKIHTGK